MKIKILVFLIACFTIFGGVKNDVAAPTFTLMNQDSEIIDLASFKGKKVILEWTNHDCPFVKRHYDTDNMQDLQKEYTENDVIWLSIISSAKGKQGYVTKSEAKELTINRDAQPSHVLFDSNGDVGKLYDAKTTPHMFIIDEVGMLRYQGAIDNLGSTGALFSTDLSKAKNYVRDAMKSLFLGEDVKEKNTRPYGCSVKY
tara:strand:+ start:15127 stop:15726 length:600 start_codon:yes stop_codon:yes gene_type:complete